jgi:hypothetical protein
LLDNATTEKDNETDQIIGGNVVKNGYDFMVSVDFLNKKTNNSFN